MSGSFLRFLSAFPLSILVYPIFKMHLVLFPNLFCKDNVWCHLDLEGRNLPVDPGRCDAQCPKLGTVVIRFLSGLNPPCILVPIAVLSIWKAGGEMAGGPSSTTTFIVKLQSVPPHAEDIPARSWGLLVLQPPFAHNYTSHLTAALAHQSS